MSDHIRVLVLGTGQMGSGIARLVLEKQGLELVGAYARRKERDGLDLGLAIGLGRSLGLRVSTNLDEVIKLVRPHVAIQATCSHFADAKVELVTLVRHGVHVISIAEEMAFPASHSRENSGELEVLTRHHNVAVLGTGINPGFVLDLLIITLSGVCADIQSIRARRVNDLSPYGQSVLVSQGVGLTPDDFQRGLENGSVVGHIGFPESLYMIGAAVGWDLERVEEERKPIISRVTRNTPFVVVQPGQVAGCLHTAVAYRKGKSVITLIHPQEVHPQLEGVETGDLIEISGTPNVRFTGTPEIPGGLSTCALAVNMIPRLLNAGPGLYSMADLPAPAAMLGDARKLVRNISQLCNHG